MNRVVGLLWLLVGCGPPASVTELAESWSTPDGAPLRMEPVGTPPTVRDLMAARWEGAESVLAYAVVAAATPDPRGVPTADVLAEPLRWALSEAPDSPLAPAARVAMLGAAADLEDPWQAWVSWARARNGAPSEAVDAATALLDVWAAHPEACRRGGEAAVRLDRLVQAQEGFVKRCPDAATTRTRAALAWARLDPAASAAVLEAGGLGLQATQTRCAAGLAGPEDVPSIDVPARAVVMGWCAATSGREVHSARLAAAEVGGADPSLRLLRAVLALQDDAPKGVVAAIDSLDGSRATALRARSAIAQADTDAARSLLVEALESDPDNLHLLRLLARVDATDARRRLASLNPAWALMQTAADDPQQPWSAIVPEDWPAGFFGDAADGLAGGAPVPVPLQDWADAWAVVVAPGAGSSAAVFTGPLTPLGRSWPSIADRAQAWALIRQEHPGVVGVAEMEYRAWVHGGVRSSGPAHPSEARALEESPSADGSQPGPSKD